MKTKFGFKLKESRKKLKTKQRVVWNHVCETTFRSKNEQLIAEREMTNKRKSRGNINWIPKTTIGVKKRAAVNNDGNQQVIPFIAK